MGPSQYIVEVWSDESTLQSLVRSGYRTISAYGYYLNNQEPVPGETTGQWVDTWKLMYQFDPLAGTSLTPSEIDLFLGGEAAMWPVVESVQAPLFLITARSLTLLTRTSTN